MQFDATEAHQNADKTVVAAERLRAALYRVLSVWAFGGIPLLIFVSLFVIAGVSAAGDYAFDFKQFWQGAHDVVHGHSPYPTQALLETSSDRLGPVGIQHVFRFPYPAATAVLLAPFGALPFHLAAALYMALLLGATVASLWLVGLRDWRVYGIVFATVTLNGAIRLGTLTPVVMLLLALAWRYRNRRAVAVPALAVAIVLKLFVWPILLWLVATRRYATAALTAAAAALFGLVGWAAIGFDGLSLYPELVRRLNDVVGDRGFSLLALGAHIGLGAGVSQALPYLVGLPVGATAILVGRRDRNSGDDRAAFAIAILAAILLTPIVWLHYFALLFVPLAIARPRLSWPWGLPLLFWFVPAQETFGAAWKIVVGLGLAAAIAAASAHAPDAVDA